MSPLRQCSSICLHCLLLARYSLDGRSLSAEVQQIHSKALLIKVSTNESTYQLPSQCQSFYVLPTFLSFKCANHDGPKPQDLRPLYTCIQSSQPPLCLSLQDRDHQILCSGVGQSHQAPGSVADQIEQQSRMISWLAESHPDFVSGGKCVIRLEQDVCFEIPRALKEESLKRSNY